MRRTVKGNGYVVAVDAIAVVQVAPDMDNPALYSVWLWLKVVGWDQHEVQIAQDLSKDDAEQVQDGIQGLMELATR